LALSLFDAFGLEPASIIEMVGPTVSYFKDSDKKIAVCATPATVRAGIYQNAFRMLGKEIGIVAIPDLAGAIEFGESAEKQRALIVEAFKDSMWEEYDVLVLACTHYPLALSLFREVVPTQVAIFDPAEAVAERAIKQFWPQEVRDGKTMFVISKDSEPFRKLVAEMFPGEEEHIEVL
jgi:glutamate racemase